MKEYVLNMQYHHEQNLYKQKLDRITAQREGNWAQISTSSQWTTSSSKQMGKGTGILKLGILLNW